MQKPTPPCADERAARSRNFLDSCLSGRGLGDGLRLWEMHFLKLGTTKGLSFSHQGAIGEAVKNPILVSQELLCR